MSENHLTISCWAENDRPREKLIHSGASSLSDAELLAILLRTGSKNSTALDVARQLLSASNNDFSELARFSISDLSKIKGVGPVKSVTLIAALELGRRKRATEARQKEKITNSKDAAELLLPHLCDLPHEEFWIIFLNRANKVISTKSISKGGVNGTVVDPKIVFREALEQKASSVILCHNHPSGNLNPSEADIQLTKKLRDAGKNLEISVLDHLIIAGSSFYSFADEGIL